MTDGQAYRRCGFDADSRHGHQDLGKREVIEEFFDFFGHDGSLVFEFLDLGGDAGNDQFDVSRYGTCFTINHEEPSPRSSAIGTCG
ncbi:hypothetical protein AB4074_22200 [Arthrobacter sp. 2MCAF14]